jgi:glycosyltransferase involved in cell wall biosynthesis
MKQRILVLASTFPRWKNDTLPPFVFELSRGLAKYFNITVLAPHYSGAKHQETMDGMDVRRFSYMPDRWEKLAGEGGIMPNLHNNPALYLTVPFFFIAEILAAIELVRQLKPKLIHAHWIIPQGITAFVVKKVLKTPYIITVHGGDIYGLQNPLLIRMKKSILQQAKRITVVSSDIKKEIINIDPHLASKIEIIPMGVDSKLFNPSKYDERIKKKYAITGPFLLFVGRLVEKKGVAYLLKAMPAILKEKPTTKLMIIGAGPEKDNLVHLAAKLNIKDNIIFVGALPHSDLPKYYATADYFISLSVQGRDGDRDGLPTSLIEASFSGCIPMTTKFGAASELIENNKTGYLIDVKNINTIVEKLNSEDRSIKEMKNNTRKNSLSKFDIQIIANRFKKQYFSNY